MSSHTTQQIGDYSRVESPSEMILSATSALSSAVQTTLGPNGMDKMIINDTGTVVVTNDGSYILKQVDIENPVGRMLKQVAETQADTIGDGTTTAVILAGELLQTAKSLHNDGIHPTKIIDGYTKAVNHASQQLRNYGIKADSGDKARLRQVAETAVTGRWDSNHTRQFAGLAVEALQHIDFDTSHLTLKSYPGGELQESEQIDGLLVDIDTSSTSIESVGTTTGGSLIEPAVAMVNDEIGIEVPDCIEVTKLQSTEQLSELQSHEESQRTAVIKQIIDLDVDILVCQKSINERIRNRLVNYGVLAVERTRQDEFDTIARVTGSSPTQSVSALEQDRVGHAEVVEQRAIGPTSGVIIRGSTNEAQSSLLLRGGTDHVSGEIRRIINDCIDVVRLTAQNELLIPSGGAAAVALASDISDYAVSVSDRAQIVVEGFAEAIELIPGVLAQNAGRNPIDTIPTLRRRHHAGEHMIGVGPDGRPKNMIDAGAVEPAIVFYSALKRATEAALMMLRIDDMFMTEGSDTHGERGSPHGEYNHSGQTGGGYPWTISH